MHCESVHLFCFRLVNPVGQFDVLTASMLSLITCELQVFLHCWMVFMSESGSEQLSLRFYKHFMHYYMSSCRNHRLSLRAIAIVSPTKVHEPQMHSLCLPVPVQRENAVSKETPESKRVYQTRYWTRGCCSSVSNTVLDTRLLLECIKHGTGHAVAATFRSPNIDLCAPSHQTYTTVGKLRTICNIASEMIMVITAWALDQ
eukprot:SAG31_NODE_129_length_23447_cov_5.010922_10_plen_201_part_00